MAPLGSGLNGGVVDCGDSGPLALSLPPRTHTAGCRLPRVLKCVLGDNREKNHFLGEKKAWSLVRWMEEGIVFELLGE